MVPLSATRQRRGFSAKMKRAGFLLVGDIGFLKTRGSSIKTTGREMGEIIVSLEDWGRGLRKTVSVKLQDAYPEITLKFRKGTMLCISRCCC